MKRSGKRGDGVGIIELAQSVADEYETHNPFSLCRAIGITVHYYPLVEFRGYYMNIDGHNFITIADNLSEIVGHFVCAHELGHHFLHQRLNRPFMDYRTHMVPGRYENEADKFALHFLFTCPPLYQDNNISNEEMANLLNVSVSKVDSRLIELGVYF